MMDLKAYLNERKKLVDEFLDRAAPKGDVFPESLHSSMRYSLEAGGKRVRPVLVIAAAEAVAGADAVKLPGLMAAACSLELVHTYSLVHDDLPAMDNDDFRRGKPTNHKVFGEAVAILAGDALLTLAFELLSDTRFTAGLDPVANLAIIKEIACAAGSMGMVGGQVVDIESEGKEVDFAALEYIHTHKTGALIKASVKVGALAAGANPRELDALSRYGSEAGLAFQVADDILDIVGTQEEIGKDVGSDVERGKKTYPALLGLDESRRRAGELSESAVRALDVFGPDADPLREIARYIVSRKS
jgi:geranylgeranyl diphosphate synthase type II